jgi:hypothetical protein
MSIPDPRNADSLPGFKMDPDGKGFSFDHVDGHRMQMRGAAPGEQSFYSAKFGLLNISKAMAAIKREKGRPKTLKLDASVIDHIQLVDIDLKYVFEMSDAYSNEPIIMVIASDGANIIDGHHRLQRRIFDKRSNFRAHIFRPETVRYMQIQVFKQNDTGQFEQQFGMSSEQLEQEIREGNAMADRIRQLNGLAKRTARA